MGYQPNPDISLLSIRENKDHLKEVMLNDKSEYESNTNYISLKQQNIHNQAENTAADISYRCISCIDCKDRVNNEHIENISVREEVEQDLIDKSVQLTLETVVQPLNCFSYITQWSSYQIIKTLH